MFGLYLTGAPGTEYKIEVVSETDRLSPTPTPTPTPFEEVEPNDDYPSANAVELGQVVSGEGDRGGGVDTFKTYLDEGQRVNATFTNFGSDSLTVYITGGPRLSDDLATFRVASGATESVSFRAYSRSPLQKRQGRTYIRAKFIEVYSSYPTRYEFEIVPETDQPSPTPTPTPTATPIPTPTPTPGPPTHFQIDLVEGEPIERLDPEAGDTYHKQGRFITALTRSEEEGNAGGPGSYMGRTYESDGCEVAYSLLGFDPDTGLSEVAVEVSDVGGCEDITLSYVGYELPEGTTGWDPDRADEQELRDSETVTLEPGQSTSFIVDVVDEETPTPTPTPSPTPTPRPELPVDYQIDLVEGDPIERLDPEAGDTYHKQGRLITAFLIDEDDRRRGGPGFTPRRTYSSDGCEIDYTRRSFNPNTGTSRVGVTVEDAGGCEGITLTYVGYELPDGSTGWDADRADEQELKDSMTRTLSPGDEMVFIVNVFDQDPPTTGTFEVADIDAPDVEQGEIANVTATIENTGDTAGTQKVNLSTEGAAARGATKLDIVFVVDDVHPSPNEMEDVQGHIRNFSSQLDRAEVDARYALVSFANEPEVDQEYTSNISEFQDSVDRLTRTSGSERADAWDAIRMALELEAREDSTPVVILIGEAPAYHNNEFSDLIRSQVASLIDEANASLITVTSVHSDVASRHGDTTALAGDVEDGTHFDLVKYDFGGPISDEIAALLIERSRTREVTLALAPGESARVSYSVSTDDVPPGTYNITVSTENESESTTLTVTD